MKKSLKNFSQLVNAADEGQLKEGFLALKNLRGGLLVLANNPSNCSNTGTCSGNNSGVCSNSGKCTDANNTAGCTNSNICLM